MQVLTDTLAKMSQTIYVYFFISEHSAFISSSEKKLFWLLPAGLPPPPFTDLKVFFYDSFPYSIIVLFIC